MMLYGAMTGHRAIKGSTNLGGTHSTQLEQASAVLDYLSEPAAVVDPSYRIYRCNAAFEAALGAVAGGLAGQRLPAIDTRTLAQAETYDLAGTKSHIFQLGSPSDPLTTSASPLVIDDAHVGYLCQASPRAMTRETSMKYLLENLDQGIWDYDTRRMMLTVSDAWRRMRGVGLGEDINATDNAWLDYVHPEERDLLREAFKDQTRGRIDQIDLQYRCRHADGHWVWILCRSAVSERDDNGLPLRIVGTDTDITQLKKTKLSVQHLQRKLQLALKASGIGVWEFNSVQNKLHWDDRMLEIYGLTDGQNERPVTTWEDHLHPDDFQETMAYSDKCNLEGNPFQRDYRIVRPDGAVRHVRSLASQDITDGEEARLIGVNIDVTDHYARARELEIAKAQLEYDSRHDALTGLANRRLLDETTEQLSKTLVQGHTYAVLHLDLDHFKKVNDTFGHAAGDAVLISVANDLRGIVGESGLVCRIGGDEFAVLYQTAPQDTVLTEVCQNIVSALGRPIPFETHSCHIGVSIGCAIGRGPTPNVSRIFINADAALYAAKQAGRNCFRLHHAAL